MNHIRRWLEILLLLGLVLTFPLWGVLVAIGVTAHALRVKVTKWRHP